MKLSVVLLIGMLLIAAGAWQSQANVQSWSELLEINKFFSLLGVLGSVVVTWASRSPFQNKGK